MCKVICHWTFLIILTRFYWGENRLKFTIKKANPQKGLAFSDN